MNAPHYPAWIETKRVVYKDMDMVGVVLIPCHGNMPQQIRFKVFSHGYPIYDPKDLIFEPNGNHADDDPVEAATQHLHQLLASAKG